MAQQFNSPDFGTLTIPSAVAQYNVQASNAGLATSGVVMIVGEADAGPDYTLETDLNANKFGPSQLGDVISKYQSGPIVDAVRAFCNPANDPNITGAPTAFVIAKTNPSAQAKAALTDYNTSTYATLGASLLGAGGNNISLAVTAATAEQVPTTGPFTVLVNLNTLDIVFRVNGAAAVDTGTIGANTLPSAFQAAIAAAGSGNGFTATGGANRAVLASGSVGQDQLALAVVAGNQVTITITQGGTGPGTFAATAHIGDTLYISTSSILGGSAATAGSYVVTGTGTTTVIHATKLQDASGTPGTVTAPTAVSATTIAATTDLGDFSPVTISVAAGNPVDGLGKSLEIAVSPTSEPDNLTNIAYALGTSKVTWVSTLASPQVLVSVDEYEIDLQANNIVTNFEESFVVGGEIGLQVSYEGTTAQLVVGASSLVLTWTGGINPAGTLTLPFKNFPSIQALATYIDAQKGFSAQPGNGILGLLPSTALDEGTFTVCSTYGSLTGRVKVDAYRFINRAIGQSVQVVIAGAAPVSGLPEPTTGTEFLSGGTQGGSTDATITGAITALQNVKGNFLVPLFSQDSDLDAAAGNTDPSSMYDIASINAFAKTSVLLCSQPKRKRGRQALLSVNSTFASDQTSASNIASFRCAMCFQSVQTTGSSGALQYFQPWMLAGLAASMQAAGFYKGIVNKYININSIADSSGDYNDQDDDQETDALLAGLLPAKRDLDAGGVYFVSDQTTYGSDSNFVYNSLQAVYVADTMALTCAQRMQKAFVGQSIADVSASQAVAYVKNILADFLTLKLISPSDGAPKGYVPGSIVVRVTGTVMQVTFTVFLAGLIYFVPIVFQINQVTQTASA